MGPMGVPEQGASEASDTGEVVRLVAAFQARPAPSVIAKLDLLLRLARLDDPRVTPFLLAVAADRGESNEVRASTLKWLSGGLQRGTHRGTVADVILGILPQGASPDLRLQAVLALAEFTDVDGVLAALCRLVLDTAESIELRYTALTSLERGGPTPECTDCLRQLAGDEAFGESAKGLLARWQKA